MTYAEAAMIMMGKNGKKPVIQSIVITQFGDYEIKAPGNVDGYNPIHVNLKDRYDEGYKDGYNDAKEVYEKIIRQLNGDGEPATDDDGNTIDNAIVADDSEINDILRGVVFPNGGGTVNVYGLTGADTYFQINQITTTNSDGITSKQVQLSVINKQTGETKVTASSMNIKPATGGTIMWKIESVSFGGANNRTSVRVNVIPYINGVAQPRYSAGLSGLASNVGGTSFGSIGSQTAITQQGA